MDEIVWYLGEVGLGYLDIVTEQDILQSRKWLEAAVARAETEAQKKRAGLLLKAFEYYEASALSFIEEMRAFKSPPASENEALDLLNSVERYITMKEKRWKLVDEFQSDPVLRMPLKPSRYRLTTGDLWGCYPLWAVYDWAKKSDGNIRKRIDELAFSPEETVRSYAGLMLDVLEGTVMPVSKNSAFNKSLKGWKITTKGKGKVTWNGTEGHNENGSLFLNGSDNFMIEQKVPINKQNYTCLGFVKVMEPLVAEGNVELALSVVDNSGKDFVVNVWSEIADWHKTSLIPRPGIWTTIATTIDISAITDNKKPESLIVRLTIKDLGEGSKVYIDDLGLYAHEK